MASKVTKLPTKPNAGTVHWLNECIARGEREVFSEPVTISPGLANIILAKNEHNRNIRQTKLEQFIADMRKGRWAFNGEPLILANTGELNDGQHRLCALIDANVTLPFLMVFGVERETRTTVDQGAARTASDYLHMEGVVNSATLAGLVRLTIAYELSGYDSIMRAAHVSNAQVLARARSDELAHEAAAFAQGTTRVEQAEPGIVRRVLDERLEAGQEPTKAAVRKATSKRRPQLSAAGKQLAALRKAWRAASPAVREHFLTEITERKAA